MRRFLQNRLVNEADENKRIELKQRSIYIIPSRFGLIYLLFLIILLILAINFDSALVYLLLFLLAGIYLNAIFSTWRNLAGLQFSTARSEPIFVGEEAQFKIAVEAKLRDYLAITLSLNNRSNHFDIEKGGRKVLVLTQEGKKRGILKMGRVTVESRYPLGLFRAWSYLYLDSSLLVYPRPLENQGFSFSHDQLLDDKESSDLLGQLSDGVEDYEGLRPYRAGDPLQRIYWSAYAKGQGVYIKQFRGDDAETIWIRDDAQNGPLEEVLSKMAYLILLAEERGYRYGFKLGSLEMLPESGVEHRDRCLQALALYQL